MINNLIYDFKKVTTELVSKYHPDKYADQISDSFVKYILGKDINSKVAIETLVKDEIVVVAGEVSGYRITDEEVINIIHNVADKLNYRVRAIYNFIGEQSSQIKNAVERVEIGAGDQGFVYGFATRETPDYMPLGHYIGGQIIKEIENVADAGGILKGDAKTQIVDDNGVITDILVSVCHKDEYSLDEVQIFIKSIVNKVLIKNGISNDLNLIINPAGRWTIGGPAADAGLTGRKIVADQYGGYMSVGGGALSGKDLTKVDRSGAYMARRVAVELLDKVPTLNWVKIQVGYAIGLPTPMSLVVNSNLGDIRMLVDERRFHVSNLISELSDLDFYELSKGSHYRDLIIRGKE